MKSLSEVKSIRFGIIGDADIERLSVCVVNNPSLSVEYGTVYDPRLGCVQNNSTCPTCNEDIWNCPGHFGHVNLNVPIILFYKQCVPMLKCFCFSCHRLLCTSEELTINGIRGYDAVVEYASKLTSCARCFATHPEIRLNAADATLWAQHKLKNSKAARELTPVIIKSVFDDVCDEDVRLLDINPTMFHPRNLVLTKFLVLPTCCRPKVITSSTASDDDLSIMLIDIIKNNVIIEKNLTKCVVDETVKAANDKAAAAIKFKTLAYCDNSKGKATYNTNHKPMTGIKERITKKTGIVRQNLMGKRCDKTARTVLGPDPTLKLDEVAVPVEIAKSLTMPEWVTPLNYDVMTALVNSDEASTVTKPNGTKINVAHAKIARGTQLHHGDEIVRADGSRIVVKNCRMKLAVGDVVTRNGKIVPTTLPRARSIKLEIGDRIDRYLKNGDPLLLNRQPTLHRNSMQGMKVVIKPGKTFRVNLAIVKGFNMDFDGDEGNLFCFDTLESKSELLHVSNAKKHMLSNSTPKSEMVIVQDSLLGAYKMTCVVRRMSVADFYDVAFRTGAFERYPNFDERLEFVKRSRNESYPTSHALFGFLFPPDFHVAYPNLTIRNGVVMSGYFDAFSLSKSPSSIVRLLCCEYGEETAANFVDDLQFATNAWLEINPFSIEISDCLLKNADVNVEIAQTIHRYFLEADNVAKLTDDQQIKETRINCALNKAKDIGLKIAKEALHPENNFISTVTSGSKGDYFNIAQITGLLGQQNVTGARPVPTLDDRTRTIVHYPRVITESSAKYESRGFVASSFLSGMNPKVMFFHAMTGREGMTSTAMSTATSGYIQRSCVKLNEDLKVAYDGTVRDANQNVYQFAYGNHGFDPSKIDIVNDDVRPVNVERLADRLGTGRKLSAEEIDDIVDGCRWNRQIPDVIYDKIWNRHESYLRNELRAVRVSDANVPKFASNVVEKYHTSRASPGDSVGIIAAQSIGERQTQTTLNVFHTAGKLQSSGRLDEILNMPKSRKTKTCTIYFKVRYETADELRRAIGCDLVGLRLPNVASRCVVTKNDGGDNTVRYELNMKRLYAHRLNPAAIADKIPNATFTATTISVNVSAAADNDELDSYKSENEKILLCGIDGITAMHLDHDGTEWYVVTEGSNLRKLLAWNLVDAKRLYCNNVWEVYECLGIYAVRKMLLEDIKKVVVSVNDVHLQLLVDKMTVKGKPMSITRYTMRTNDVGPLSKATFEESIDILLNAAVKTETEHNLGVSAAIISGNQPRVGTGMMNLKINMDALAEEIPAAYYR